MAVMMFSIVPIIIVYLSARNISSRASQPAPSKDNPYDDQGPCPPVRLLRRHGLPRLNGLPNVSEQARSAILALAQERGYQLNTNAKYLKQIHSSGIVAVVTGTSNELFAQMIERIQQTLPTDRYPLTVDYVDENEDPVERALHLSREKKPAGLLFLGGDRRMYAKSFGEITLRPSC